MDGRGGPLWRKSSYSASQGDCVEVGALDSRHVGVRDTKARELGYLRVSLKNWQGFLGRIKTTY
ncbi:DUF397 domain-containing protein [Saccharopolyspora gloriosae]|uniref:DUF397 domain-containing protein n=1 Tax=Saccharopolyspora gloriosae TaxID=455344 RepID=UPI001FB703FD|nr:DUF397 domain-containing protein [Saccharopolyspora gloriosae]